MPRTTDLPERIVRLLESVPRGRAPMTAQGITEALESRLGTVSTHLRALVENGHLERVYVYGEDASVPFPAKVGRYLYSAKGARKNKAPTG